MYAKLATYFENKGVNIEDVENDFRLVYHNDAYSIENWNVEKLGEQPSIDTINALAESTLPVTLGNRRAQYPKIVDQLDMLFHDMTAGKSDKTGTWYAAIAKVKSDNPKL